MIANPGSLYAWCRDHDRIGLDRGGGGTDVSTSMLTGDDVGTGFERIVDERRHGYLEYVLSNV